MAKEVIPTKLNGYQCGPSVLTYGRKLLRLTYDALSVKFKGKIKFCDGYGISKSKSQAVIKKTYTRASNLGKRIFVDTTGPIITRKK